MRTHDEIIAEAQRRHPHNHIVDDPFGETGEAQSDPYGYEETARLAFIAGGAYATEGEAPVAAASVVDGVAKAMCAVETRSKAATLEEVQSGIQRWTRHRHEAERLIDELRDYGLTVQMVETPTTDDRHDSDCATHNEPAYPNGPCDCRLSDHEAVRQAVADAIDDAAVITPRNEFLGGSTIANLAEVADAVLKVLPAATRRPSPPTESEIRKEVARQLDAIDEGAEQGGHPSFQDEPSAFLSGFREGAVWTAARVGGEG